MRIESIKVRNFKALQDIEIRHLTNLTVIVGRNGVGKTSLFDVFEFLHDCLEKNVNFAIQSRGGFKEVVSRGKEKETILFEIKFRYDDKEPLITYHLELEHQLTATYVKRELLSFRRGSKESPWNILDFTNGKGIAMVGDLYNCEKEKYDNRIEQKLDSADILALKGLGQFSEFPAIASFRKMVEDWYVSDFSVHASQNDNNSAVPAQHLSRSGDNLSQVAKYLYDNHRETFNEIIQKMQQRIPGISTITADTTVDNRLVLRFRDGAFKDPFLSKYASDGTMKMFAYLVMLNNPNPCSLLCIEEPENQLYPEILEILADEFREYSTRGQVFVSTHSPDFLNAIDIKEVVLLEKENGYTKTRRLTEDNEVSQLFNSGDKLGWLWKQGYFQDYHHKSDHYVK
jgi:predicted ATPase